MASLLVFKSVLILLDMSSLCGLENMHTDLVQAADYVDMEFKTEI